jgi:hypothetical protein
VSAYRLENVFLTLPTPMPQTSLEPQARPVSQHTLVSMESAGQRSRSCLHLSVINLDCFPRWPTHKATMPHGHRSGRRRRQDSISPGKSSASTADSATGRRKPKGALVRLVSVDIVICSENVGVEVPLAAFDVLEMQRGTTACGIMV